MSIDIDRRFPDVHRVLIAMLDQLPELAGGERTGMETPTDLQDRLPFVRVMRVAGGSDQLNDFPNVDIDVFAATYGDAERLAERIRQYLCGPPPPHASLDRIDCTMGPRQLPWGGDGVRRWGTTYDIIARRQRWPTGP